MIDESLIRNPARHIDYLPDQYRPGALRRALRYALKLGIAEYPQWYELDQGGRWSEEELLRAERWFDSLGPDTHARLLRTPRVVIDLQLSDARLVSLVPQAFMRHLQTFVDSYAHSPSHQLLYKAFEATKRFHETMVHGHIALEGAVRDFRRHSCGVLKF